MAEFHRRHFSHVAVDAFSKDFVALPPHTAPFSAHSEQECDEWEEEDDLGYYEDGVKRTLTDEQIEIFRHSELRDLQRAQEKGTKTAVSTPSAAEADDGKRPVPSNSSSNARSGKKNKKKTKQFKKEPKPDLRKRTWDVVESGLDSLEYD